jgi:hypothetical protein
VVIGSGSASFEMIRHLFETLPLMPAPSWVRNRIEAIAVRDVLHYLVGAASLEGPINRTFDIGCRQVLTYAGMMKAYAAEAGRGTEDYEIQMLFGIRDIEQTRLVAEGVTVRTYVPFGDDWYGYFMRRLAERPANLIFFLRSLVGQK